MCTEDTKDITSYNGYEDENLPAETDYEEIDVPAQVDGVMNDVDNICRMVNNVSCNVAQTRQAIANVELEIAKLDHNFDVMLLEAQKSLTKFNKLAPMLEKQLEGASGRLDRITDTILSRSDDSLTPESLEKQRQLIEVLTTTNETFNNLLVKLITI